MALSNLPAKPLPELAALIKSRKLSPVELTDACLNNIEARDREIRAFLTVTAEQAEAQAQQAETEIRKGRYKGPLHGIPYAVKDIIATKGIRTTNGSLHTANWIPTADAAVITRLHNAGAILLGKLNLLEFAMGSGQAGLNGPTRNPWHLDYSPSGSSSGSGAALAAAMTPLTLGSDSGGSIRGPAKSCGVVGLKPTYGLVPVDGVTTLTWTLDHVGPMARTTAGAARMLEVIAGKPIPPSPIKLKGLRLGVPTTHFFNHVHPETASALTRAIEVCKQLGARVVDCKLTNAHMVGAASSVILGSESAAYHQQRLKQHPEQFNELVRERLEANSRYTAVDYIQALRLRTILIEEVSRQFETCDVLMLPAGNAAPKLTDEIVTTDLPRTPPPAPRPDSFNLANVTGIPALVLPCGFTQSQPKLPLGIQFCARHHGEATLFQLAQAYESATNWLAQLQPQ